MSPHFDDAVGSAGGVIKRLIASGEKCTVMTLMAAVPWSHPKAAYYVLRRRRENGRAARVLDCGVLNAPFLDAIYRKEMRKTIKAYSKSSLFTAEVSEHDLVENIRKYILANTGPLDVVIAPAGLGNHMDHRIVNLAAAKLDRPVYFYEEFYYDIKEKGSLLTAGYEYAHLSQAEIGEKLKAMLKYDRTLRKLFRPNWRQRLAKYYMEERVDNGIPYERFDNIGFLNGK